MAYNFQSALKSGLSPQEITNYLTSKGRAQEAHDYFGIQDKKQEEPGFLSRVGEDLKKRGQDAKNALMNSDNKLTGAEAILQTTGSLAGGVGDVLGQGINSGINALPESVKDVGRSALQSKPGQAIMSGVGSIMNKYNSWAQQNPRAAKDLESVVNIASLIPTEKVASLATEGAEQAARSFGKKTLQVGGEVLNTGKKGAEKIFPNTIRSVEGSIERVKPNLVAKNLENDAYKALTAPEREAVRGGLLPRDVADFSRANPTEKGILKRLVTAAEETTDGGRGKIHPSEIIGEQMNKRIKLLDDERKRIGNELGEKVKELKITDLGGGGTGQVQADVIKRLNKVPGLEGIKISSFEDGNVALDFTDTALSGSQTKGAREELQNLFNDLNNRNPYQLHRLRQEIFESLGGKKSAQLQLTETQEQAMDAIREGISDSLERSSKGYKELNSSYRETITPLKELRRFFKGTEGASKDILDEKAGLLMRRLTSNVASGPELRRIIDDIGNQLTKHGYDISEVDLNKLQDFYNALNRYYDLAKDTSFEGLIKSANANPTDFSKTGIVTKVINTATKNINVTKATQRAAIKKLLNYGSFK